MSKINEVIDSLSDEQITSEAREMLRTEAIALEKHNSQLYQRAKKAEGFEKTNDGKWIKKEEPKSNPIAQTEKTESSEPDYARLAYLENKGINHPDDQKIVQDESARLKLPLTDILNMSHIKAQLDTAREQREALAGMPKGRGKGGGQTQHDVDYWIGRQKSDGTYETPEDPELAIKVIDARIKKESQANKFSDIMYTG